MKTCPVCGSPLVYDTFSDQYECGTCSRIFQSWVITYGKEVSHVEVSGEFCALDEHSCIGLGAA